MTTDLEVRISRLEAMVDKLAPYLELVSTRIPPVIEKQWLLKEMETRGYLTWGELRADSQFLRLFPYPSKFYHHANQWIELKDWKTAKVNKSLYYFADEKLFSKVKARIAFKDVHPKNQAFLDYLTTEVYRADSGLNVDEFLGVMFPHRTQDWRARVVASLQQHIERAREPIDLEGEVFRKRNGTEAVA